MEILPLKNSAGTRIRTHDLPTQLFFIIATPSLQAQAPSGLHGQAPPGSQYSGGPSSGCYCHCFSHQQSNPEHVHPEEQLSICLTNKLPQRSPAQHKYIIQKPCFPIFRFNTFTLTGYKRLPIFFLFISKFKAISFQASLNNSPWYLTTGFKVHVSNCDNKFVLSNSLQDLKFSTSDVTVYCSFEPMARIIKFEGPADDSCLLHASFSGN